MKTISTWLHDKKVKYKNKYKDSQLDDLDPFL